MLLDTYIKLGGKLHSLEQCIASRNMGGPKSCAIHNRTPHKLLGSPRNLRETTLIEDLCEHGIGHPDPDSAAYMNWRYNSETWFVHGCDGCCRE